MYRKKKEANISKHDSNGGIDVTDYYTHYLSVQRLFYGGTALNFRLATLDLCHYSFNVLKLVATVPEHGAVLDHLVRCLSLNVFGYVLNVIATELLVRLDKLIEVSLRPVCEACLTMLLEMCVTCKSCLLP